MWTASEWERASIRSVLHDRSSSGCVSPSSARTTDGCGFDCLMTSEKGFLLDAVRKLRTTKIRDCLPLQELGIRWTGSSGSRDATVFAEPFRPQPAVQLHRAQYLLSPLTRDRLRIVALPGQPMSGHGVPRTYQEERH